MLARLMTSSGLAMSALLTLVGVASAATVPPSITVTGPGMTFTVTSVVLVTRAAVNVDITVVCDPIDENGTLVSALGFGGPIYITEAISKNLAVGNGFVSGNATCDSSTVNHFTALIVSSTVPFKTGDSVIRAYVQASDENFCCQFRDLASIEGAIKIQR